MVLLWFIKREGGRRLRRRGTLPEPLPGRYRRDDAARQQVNQRDGKTDGQGDEEGASGRELTRKPGNNDRLADAKAGRCDDDDDSQR
jgi:hypothetical protein